MMLPPLIQIDEYSLTEQVFHTLKQGILSLQIKPREYLIIGEVAEQYGLSRTPVREALIMLEREGWVENDGRRGSKVTVPSAESILHVIEIQAVLESYVARRAAELLTDADLNAIEQLLNEADEQICANNAEQAHLLGAGFHGRLAQPLANPRLCAEIVALTQHVDRVRPLIWRKDRAPIEESAKQHRAIFKALRARDADKAGQLMFDHTVWFEKELSVALLHL